MQQGEFEEADRLLSVVLETDDQCSDAWHYHGLAAAERGDTETALLALERASALTPDNVDLLANYARLLVLLHEYDKALKLISRARELAPASDQVLVRQIMTLLAAGLGDEALPALKELLSRATPDARFTLLMLQMRACSQAGRRAEAEQSAAEACALNPTEATAYLELCDCMGILGRSSSARRAVLLRAFRADRNSHKVLLALGQDCAQRGRFAPAVRLTRRAIRASANRDYLAWFTLCGVMPPKSSEALLAGLNACPQPTATAAHGYYYYFALGKVLESLERFGEAASAYQTGNRLAAQRFPHDRQRSARRLESLLRRIDHKFIDRTKQSLDEHCTETPIFIVGMPRSGTTLVERMLAGDASVRQGGELELIRDALVRRLGLRKQALLGDALAQLTENEITDLTRDLHATYRERRQGYMCVTDKMPFNFELLGLIHAVFPNAPLVHVRRDPLDTCFSCYATPFGEGNGFSYSFEDLAFYYGYYRNLMAHWKKLIPSERLLELHYESLVSDPVPSTRRLAAHCRVDWSSSMLEFHGNEAEIGTASFYQARQPLYRGSVTRARRFADYLGPLAKMLQSSEKVDA